MPLEEDSQYLEIDHDDQFNVKIAGKGERSLVGFKDSKLGLNEKLVENITKLNFITPTPIQCYGMPQIAADIDVMCCSCTGSGKTATYLLPILNNILKCRENGGSGSQNEEDQEDGKIKNTSFPKALVLVPTRELAEQIRDDAVKYSNGLSVMILAVYGGDHMGRELRVLKWGKIDVLIATPGRLTHLLEDFSVLSLMKTKFLVIDEADEMFNRGFFPQINVIIKDHMKPKEGRVTAMFSATFPKQIQFYAKKHLRPGFVFVVVGILGGASPDVIQEVVPAAEVEKRMKLYDMVVTGAEKKTLVFCNTIEKVESVSSFLRFKKLKYSFIHSEIIQAERDQAIKDFHEGKAMILVATSVAARGLNIDEVAVVVNYDLPKDINDYVQRIGRARTACTGDMGIAYSFYDVTQDQELNSDLVFALKSVNQPVPEFLMDEASDDKELAREFKNENEDFILRMKKFKIETPYEVTQDDWWG